MGFTLRATMSICSNISAPAGRFAGAVSRRAVSSAGRSRHETASLAKAIEFVTINETHLFLGQLARSLGQRLIPERLATGQRHMRVWSAGCATGEKAYSIAMVLRHAAPQIDLSVLATDISQSVLAVAAKVGMDRTRCEDDPAAFGQCGIFCQRQTAASKFRLNSLDRRAATSERWTATIWRRCLAGLDAFAAIAIYLREHSRDVLKLLRSRLVDDEC